MPRTVNVHDAKTHLSRLLADVAAGGEVVLAKAGRPIARLVSIDEPAERPLGFATGTITDAFFEPLDDEELSAWP